MTRKTAWIVAGAVLATIAVAGIVYGGVLNVAADEPHWLVTTRLLETIRERSITARAAGATVPDLSDPDLVRLGAEHYDAMCVGCHLAPGVDDTEMRAGLYP